MSIANTVVSGLLRSPLHRLLSGSTDLVRYTGKRSGREIITPTQFARRGDDVIILVGHPEKKTWWRNFTSQGDIDVLLQRRWVPMTARAVIGADDPETIGPLLDAYLTRFPRAERMLSVGTNGSGDERAVVVWCRSRTPQGQLRETLDSGRPASASTVGTDDEDASPNMITVKTLNE